MRLAAALISLVLSAPAYAGGIGLLVTGGAHTETLWFHSNAVERDGEKIILDDPKLYEKYEIRETRPHSGGGLEVLLGDRDDKITSVFRFYYLQDAAQVNPAEVTSQVDAENVVAAYRDKARHIGIGSVGLNFGIIGRPENVLVGLGGRMGSGFLTNDHTEFLMVDAMPTVQIKATRQIFVFAEAGYQMRYHKGFSHSMTGLAGARYMFD